MQKRGLMFAFTSIFLVAMINFVSAQFYGGFSLENILDSFGAENIALFLIFGVSGLLIKWALGRTMMGRDSNIAGILAVLIAMSITAAAHFSGFAYSFDVGGLFYFFGISEGLLTIIVLLALIGGLVLIGIKAKSFGAALMTFGVFFIILSFTDFIYETATTFIIGLIFLGIGGWLWWRKKKRWVGGNDYRDYDTPSRYRPNSRQLYKQELAERRYTEKVRQAQIRARAKNIQEIREGREKRDRARRLRRGG